MEGLSDLQADKVEFCSEYGPRRTDEKRLEAHREKNFLSLRFTEFTVARINFYQISKLTNVMDSCPFLDVTHLFKCNIFVPTSANNVYASFLIWMRYALVLGRH